MCRCSHQLLKVYGSTWRAIGKSSTIDSASGTKTWGRWIKTSQMRDGIGTQFIHLLVASANDADVSSHHDFWTFNRNIFGKLYGQVVTLRWFYEVKEYIEKHMGKNLKNHFSPQKNPSHSKSTSISRFIHSPQKNLTFAQKNTKVVKTRNNQLQPTPQDLNPPPSPATSRPVSALIRLKCQRRSTLMHTKHDKFKYFRWYTYCMFSWYLRNKGTTWEYISAIFADFQAINQFFVV